MRSSERGNAVIFILIAIALFAALTYTFVRSGQRGQGNLTAGQAKLQAQALIDYGATMQKGVNKLLDRRCSENQLNFENTTFSGFTNPSTPTDGSCGLFDPAGANLTAEIPSDIPDAEWIVTANQNIYPLNPAGPYLLLFIRPISMQTCNVINQNVGNDNAPFYTMEAQKFTGLWGLTLSTGNPMFAKRIGCAVDSDDVAAFYATLIEKE